MSERPGLGTLLRALVDRLDSAVEDAYREAGLDYRPRFTPIVRCLQMRGPSRLRTIAEEARVSHSAISQTVSQMEKAGWVTKRPGVDGREQTVALTEKAMAALPRLRDCWDASDAAAKNLSADVGVDLSEMIEKALVALDHTSFHARAKRAVTASELADWAAHRPPPTAPSRATRRFPHER